jgi:hypothetical protein
MAKYKFLSPEWIEEARKIREEVGPGLQAPPLPVALKMNIVINEVPFGDGVVNAHMDTEKGYMGVDLGHLEGADVKVTTDYETAKQLFIDMDPQAAMQAFMQGKIQIEGDMAKLMALQTAGATIGGGDNEVAKRLKEITEDV